jgi:arylsulfatase A-like enzyme
MKRREFLRESALGLAAGALFGFKGKGFPAMSRPNVVYVFADQWRGCATGYAGDPDVKTPNLDSLAAVSVNFVNAVSVCPVCTPYRASLLTGRYPTSTGMFLNDLYLPDEELCMGEIFKGSGYETGYIGKWHVDGHGRSAFIPPERRQGFDYWKVAECEHDYNHSHYYSGNSSEMLYWEGYDAFAQTRDAEQYINAYAKGERPFLLVLSYGPPHFPHYQSPGEYQALYLPDTLKLRPNVPKEMMSRARKEALG